MTAFAHALCLPSMVETWKPASPAAKALLRAIWEAGRHRDPAFAAARLDVQPYSGALVELRSITASVPGEGAGSRLLAWLVAKADAFGVDILLTPDISRSAANLMDQAGLDAWYGRHGFVPARFPGDTFNRMVRTAQIPVPDEMPQP